MPKYIFMSRCQNQVVGRRGGPAIHFVAGEFSTEDKKEADAIRSVQEFGVSITELEPEDKKKPGRKPLGEKEESE